MPPWLEGKKTLFLQDCSKARAHFCALYSPSTHVVARTPPRFMHLLGLLGLPIKRKQLFF
jgi:hypothetical protein